MLSALSASASFTALGFWDVHCSSLCLKKKENIIRIITWCTRRDNIYAFCVWLIQKDWKILGISQNFIMRLVLIILVITVVRAHSRKSFLESLLQSLPLNDHALVYYEFGKDLSFHSSSSSFYTTVKKQDGSMSLGSAWSHRTTPWEVWTGPAAAPPSAASTWPLSTSPSAVWPAWASATYQPTQTPRRSSLFASCLLEVLYISKHTPVIPFASSLQFHTSSNFCSHRLK